MLFVNLTACQAGSTLPLATARPQGVSCHTLSGKGRACAPADLPKLPVGTSLADEAGTAHLVVTGHVLLPSPDGPHALFCPLLTALVDLPAGEITLLPEKRGTSLAWITLSDSTHAGTREDASGPVLASKVRDFLDIDYAQGYLLPDNASDLRALLTHLALVEGYDLILTTGGTGVAPTDVTPEATARVLDYELPGFAQAMTMASLAKTPMGAISRARAGVIGRSLVVNLPGSPKAVQENLEAVLPCFRHTIEKLHGDSTPCGSGS